jgi:hypothetical protein
MFNQRVDRIEDTATWKIWNKRWQCNVKRIDLIPEQELRTRGTFTYGNPMQDRDMINEWVLTYQSINEMVELYRRGVVIRFPKRKEAITIYELVNEHLLLWIDYLKWSGMYNAPYNDLVEMDEFACDLHAQVKFDLKNSIDKSIFQERISAITEFSRNRLIARSRTNQGRVLTDEELEQIYPKRDSLAFLIRKLQAEGGMY